MSTPSASRAERILVWDLPTRVVHWLLAASFAGAWLTAESEQWRLLHVTLGYTVAVLVVFRIAWGFAGTRYARFAQFVRGPRAIGAYLRSLAGGRPQHFTGHNPAGALAILALLALALLVTATGYATYADLGGGGLEDVHEALATAMLVVVGVHVAGVVLGSLAHHENLVRAMFTGRKAGEPREGIRGPQRVMTAAVLALVAAVWWTQWADAPATAPAHASRTQHDEDDD